MLHHSLLRDLLLYLQTNETKPRGKDIFAVNIFREAKLDNITSRLLCLFQWSSLFWGKRNPPPVPLCPFSVIQADVVGHFLLEGQKRWSPPSPQEHTVSCLCQNTFLGKASDFLISFPVLFCRDFKLLASKFSFAFVYCHLDFSCFC